MKIHIREAELTDLKQVSQFAKALTEYETKKYKDDSYDPTWGERSPGREFFARQIVSDNGVVLLASVEGSIVGYLVCKVHDVEWRIPKKTAEIINLFVLPEHRSKGIGSKLIERFKDDVKKLDAKRITVMQHVKNSEGLRFYERHGFKKAILTLEIPLP
ncbi:MAG: GNAT family N-acetyltransferase [Candidatus Dojkabacteria bacterium]